MSWIFDVTVYHWLILGSLLFSFGVYGFLTRRNLIGILMSMELMLNAGALNFAVFNYYVRPGTVDGEIMVMFIIAVAAAEVVVALAIFMALFRHLRGTDLTHADLLQQS